MTTPTDAPRSEQRGHDNDAILDDVNHPAHYQSENGLETIDVIEAFISDPVAAMLANVMKYVIRDGNKAGNSRLKDLKKASWYLNRAIQYLETHGDKTSNQGAQQ